MISQTKKEKETWCWPKSSHLSVVQYDKEAPSPAGRAEVRMVADGGRQAALMQKDKGNFVEKTCILSIVFQNNQWCLLCHAASEWSKGSERWWMTSIMCLAERSGDSKSKA